MEYVEYSSIGNRKENQDFILSHVLGEDKAVFIVADGMGGYSHGGLAAKIVAETIASRLEAGNSIKQAVQDANTNLNKAIAEKGSTKMGCCLAGAFISNSTANVFWVGDSRAYLFRNAQIEYQTEDHSLVAQLERTRKLSFAQRERYGHIVSRAIMGGKDDSVDEVCLPIQNSDELILCSDGIHKNIPIDVLLSMLNSRTLDIENRNDEFDDNHSFIYIKF